MVYGGSFLGGTAISSFQEVVKDYYGSGALASVVNRKSAPAAQVNATNDSGAVYYLPSADQLVGIGEKDVTPAGSDIRYGELTPRISLMKKAIAWGDEGIYRVGLGMVWRMGEPLNATDYPGVTISRVSRFWSLRHGQVILLAQLRGTKVTVDNDVALILVNPFDRNHVLLR